MSDDSEMPVTTTEYDAIGIHVDLPGGKSSGRLTIASDYLRFVCGGTQETFPLDGLTIKFGGARNRLVFFSHPAHPEWSVYTTDPGIITHTSLRNHPDLIRETGRMQSEKRTAFTIGIGLIVLFAGVVIGLYLLKEPLVIFLADQVPVSVEQQLGETAFQQITANSRFIDDPAIMATVESFAAPLISVVSTEQEFQFKLHIVEDDAINAFAMPGGFIVIHTALLLKADTPEEITGVLAHEIAHVTRRHSIRQIINTLGLYTLVSTFLGDLSGVTAILIDSGAMLATLQFSRDFEREADDVGWEYLSRASIDPRGMISFFGKLKDQETDPDTDGSVQKVMSFLSTHPDTAERIAYLQQKLEHHDGNVRALIHRDTFQAFQDNLRSYLKTE